MHVVKLWQERLFKLKRADLRPQGARVQVQFVPITEENAELVTSLRGAEYKAQFLRHLALGERRTDPGG